ncbi:MAG: thymidine phosphorylase [Clostridia bacterium]|nr:thymidine phosphorylase [Clostridia bacterium]MCR4576794.1 thymidine phosphorylase [Clostridiales bacterium]
MSITELLYKKRFGGELSSEEIRAFVQGVTRGEFADYQISAMLMAIAINGMTARETVDLTMEMAQSGDMLDLSPISGVKVDKHSTGGVGDTTSLVLVPLLAACGVKVAKMSGRGLGFTGGTLDKLESIPGLSISMDTDRFMKVVDESGLAIIGQTAQLAPCDKVLYALRDVTSTVDVMPLIVSSILSKKLAAGADVIVLDVKTGSGAMMTTVDKAMELARTMVDIGNRTGRRFAALVTDMNQPLGRYVGNALEVEEAIDILSGRTCGELKEVSLQLGAQILRLSGKAKDAKEGYELLSKALDEGLGLKKLAEMVKNQGGDPEAAYNTSLLPKADRTEELPSPRAGYVTRIHTNMIGYAAKALGAGREKKEDPIDPAAGLIMRVRLGEKVEEGQSLATLMEGSLSRTEEAKKLLLAAIEIGSEPAEKPELIYGVIE